MKSKKLNLNELRVKSFVTEFENDREDTVKGGLTIVVATAVFGCLPSEDCYTFDGCFNSDHCGSGRSKGGGSDPLICHQDTGPENY